MIQKVKNGIDKKKKPEDRNDRFNVRDDARKDGKSAKDDFFFV